MLSGRSNRGGGGLSVGEQRVSIVSLLVGLCFLSAGMAQTEEPLPPIVQQEPSPESPPGVWAQLEPWVDGIMAAQFQAYHLAGAVVGIARDGKVVFSKGYGYADLERSRPVDPDRTLFQIASVTKLLTWTTVMQLVEEGRLDLHTDVNQYLKSVKIPATFPEPVTMHHLLTHSAGFEDRLLRNFRRRPQDLLPLEQALARELPDRVRRPGIAGTYSNFGAALAALVVQDVSGMPWEEFAEQRILEPLAMRNTSVRQPPAGHLANQVAVGYTFESGRLVPQPLELVAAAPAGGAGASAFDMVTFGLALLDGSGTDRPLLAPATRSLMHETLDYPAPGVRGMAHGFFEADWNGRRVLSHGGDLLFTHSGLYLVLDERIVLFVAFNSSDGGRARNDFVRAFSALLLPESAEATEAHASLSDTSRLAGWYRPLRRAETTLDRLFEVLGQMKVESAGPGQLHTSPIDGEDDFWRETEPNHFFSVNRPARIVFIPAADGRLRIIPVGRTVLGWESARWHETASFHGMLLLGCFLILLTPLVFPLFDLALESRSDRMLARKAPTQTPARLLAAAVGILFITFLVWLVYQLLNPVVLIYDLPDSFRWMLLLPLVGGLLAVAQTIVTVLAWRAGYWSVFGRLHYTLTTMAALALTWQLAYWNLLGWNY